MQKQEIVQLHALCLVIRTHLEERREIPADAFRPYDEKGVPPTAIHRQKGTHEAALFRLLDGLVAVTDDATRSPNRPPPSHPPG